MKMVAVTHIEAYRILINSVQLGKIDDGQSYVIFDLPDTLTLQGDIKLTVFRFYPCFGRGDT